MEVEEACGGKIVQFPEKIRLITILVGGHFVEQNYIELSIRL